MEEEKEDEKRGRLTKKQRQQQLDFKTVTGPREFTRAGVLDAVTRLIVTNNLVGHQCMCLPAKLIVTYLSTASCTRRQHRLPQ
jgi:hypothetical protein